MSTTIYVSFGFLSLFYSVYQLLNFKKIKKLINLNSKQAVHEIDEILKFKPGSFFQTEAQTTNFNELSPVKEVPCSYWQLQISQPQLTNSRALSATNIYKSKLDWIFLESNFYLLAINVNAARKDYQTTFDWTGEAGSKTPKYLQDFIQSSLFKYMEPKIKNLDLSPSTLRGVYRFSELIIPAQQNLRAVGEVFPLETTQAHEIENFLKRNNISKKLLPYTLKGDSCFLSQIDKLKSAKDMRLSLWGHALACLAAFCLSIIFFQSYF